MIRKEKPGSGLKGFPENKKGAKMYKIISIYIMLSLGIPTVPQEDKSPAVVSTSPKNGADDVSVDIGKLIIVFDRDMDEKGISIVVAGNGKHPPFIVDPRFINKRTFTISMKRLEPGVLYSVGFNSNRRKGFRSVNGVPLKPYVLTFKTKQLNKKLHPPCGRWVKRLKNGYLEHFFFPDGEWVMVRTQGNKKSFVFGKWKTVKKNIIINMEASKGTISFAWSISENGNLVLKRNEDDPNPKVLEKWTLPKAEDLVGLWVTKWDNNSREYNLKSNGEVASTLIFRGRTIERKGTWKTKGLKIIFQFYKEKDLEAFKWYIDQKGNLTLWNENNVSQVYNRKTKKRKWFFGKKGDTRSEDKDPIIGKWTAEDEEGKAEIIFYANGKYIRRYITREEKEEFGGTWKREGDYLIVKDDEEGERMKIKFKFIDKDRLKLVIDGDTVLFIRDGAKGKNYIPKKQNTKCPKELLGTWSVEDRTGAFVLTMKNNGRFLLYTREWTKENNYGGNWSAENGKIILYFDTPSSGYLEIPFTGPNGGRLGIKLKGKDFNLTKK